MGWNWKNFLLIALLGGIGSVGQVANAALPSIPENCEARVERRFSQLLSDYQVRVNFGVDKDVLDAAFHQRVERYCEPSRLEQCRSSFFELLEQSRREQLPSQAARTTCKVLRGYVQAAISFEKMGDSPVARPVVNYFSKYRGENISDLGLLVLKRPQDDGLLSTVIEGFLMNTNLYGEELAIPLLVDSAKVRGLRALGAKIPSAFEIKSAYWIDSTRLADELLYEIFGHAHIVVLFEERNSSQNRYRTSVLAHEVRHAVDYRALKADTKRISLPGDRAEVAQADFLIQRAVEMMDSKFFLRSVANWTVNEMAKPDAGLNEGSDEEQKLYWDNKGIVLRLYIRELELFYRYLNPPAERRAYIEQARFMRIMQGPRRVL